MTLSDATNLAKWLQRHYDRDVLMPVRPGKKQPVFPHKGNAWSWRQYGDCALRGGDLAILLRSLCVVDVDDTDVARQLERDNPILLTVPTARTAHGFHYYFERSHRADTDGYYDGRAQRIAKVDLKTICATGTSGIIMAAPSTGKRWVPGRAPWTLFPNGALPTIPDTLLDAVAVPRHASHQRACLHFVDDPTHCNIINLDALPGTLARLPYFDMFTEAMNADDRRSGSDGGSDGGSDSDTAHDVTVPIPLFSKAEFQDLLRVIAGHLIRGPLTSHSTYTADTVVLASAYAAHVARVESLGDFLGVSTRVQERICESAQHLLPCIDVCPEWALTRVSDAALVEVDTGMADRLCYEPLRLAEHDPRWLLHNLPRISTTEARVVGDRVLARDPAKAALSRLPTSIVEVLCSEAGRLVLAGGAALAAVVAEDMQVSAGSDYDLYLHSVHSVDEADAIVRRVLARPDVVVMMTTAQAISFLLQDVEVQIVLRLSDSLSDVVTGFDLSPAKVLIEATAPGNNGDNSGAPLRVMAAPAWVASMRHMAFNVDERQWSRATALRVFKYMRKGFDAVVPQLVDRAALRQSPPQAQLLGLLDGASLLLGIEAVLLEYGGWCGHGSGDVRGLLDVNLPAVARHLKSAQRSDYMTAFSFLGLCRHAMFQAMGWASMTSAWFGRTARCPIVWRPAGQSAQFHPTEFRFDELTKEPPALGGGRKDSTIPDSKATMVTVCV